MRASDPIFQDEANLKPIIENDPLLREHSTTLTVRNQSDGNYSRISSTHIATLSEICFGGSWSDDEEDTQPAPTSAQPQPRPSASRSGSSSTPAPTSETKEENEPQVTLSALKALQASLEVEREKSRGLKRVLERVLGGGVEGDQSGSESESESEGEVANKGKGKEREAEVKKKDAKKGKGKMDIDTHYFDSYASNGQSPRSSHSSNTTLRTPDVRFLLVEILVAGM